VNPDFGLTVDDYVRHRAPLPASLFERLRQLGVGLPGQAVVDLGTGTGDVARALARRGCRVTGVDVSEVMLDRARGLGGDAGLDVDYRQARAEDTGLPARSADVVVAAQCWHWFDQPATAREAARLLRADGCLVICNFDWIASPGGVAQATAELVATHNAEWRRRYSQAGVGIYPEWLRTLAHAGYRSMETFSYDVDVSYTPEDWRGRIRASSGVSATLAPEEVAAFDRDLQAMLAERFPADTLSILHRVFAVVARPPGGVTA
jgi:ubiquinone/menaquinone biosynthesis C-methylase UbiE